MIRLYPEAQSDFYPKNWTAAEYSSQLDTILYNPPGEYLEVKDYQFAYVSIISKIFEYVKSFFGFEDSTQPYKLNSNLLKFLYYGEAQGFITEKHVQRLNATRHNSLSPLYGNYIQRLIAEINMRSQSQDLAQRNDRLANMRGILIQFHRNNALSLKPGFWHRFNYKPSLEGAHLREFGDSHLELSRKAEREVNYDQALDHLLYAHALQNKNGEFQNQLWRQFKAILDICHDDVGARSRHNRIKDALISMGTIALEQNRIKAAEAIFDQLRIYFPHDDDVARRIGEAYLNHKEYGLVQPYLYLLEYYYSNIAMKQMELGNAYWELHDYAKANERYQLAIQLHTSYHDVVSLGRYPQTHIEFMHARIGYAYLNFIPDYAKAIHHLSEAVKGTRFQGPENQWLFEAYIKQWKTSPKAFEQQCGEQFYFFLAKCKESQLKNFEPQVKEILLACVEFAFSGNRAPQAKNYIEKGVTIFKNDSAFITNCIDLCIKHKNTECIASKINGWDKQFFEDPVFKEKLGDVAIANNNFKAGTNLYKGAVVIYEDKISATDHEPTKKMLQDRLTDLYYKAGQLLFNHKGWTSKPQELGLEYLVKAAKGNSKYAEALAQAQLQIAQKESEKSFLLYSLDAEITSYKKAYEADPKIGPALDKLFELYLKNEKYHPQLLELHLSVLAKPWAAQFNLTAESYSKLAAVYHRTKKKKYTAHTLACLKKAHLLAPENPVYKRDFYRFNLTVAKDKLKRAWGLEDLTEKLGQIEEIITILKQFETYKWDSGKEWDEIRYGYQKTLAGIYGSLADIYLNQCLHPYGEDTNDNWKTRLPHTQKAMDNFDLAIKYDPENPVYRFEKAFLLDVAFRFEDESVNKAKLEYALAIKHCPENPFYKAQLAFFDSEREKELMAKVPKDASFTAAWVFYRKERFLKEKSQPLPNPHKYRVVSGVFSSSIEILP